MFFDASPEARFGDALIERGSRSRTRWHLDSEYGRLCDVMLSPPSHLRMVACNSITRDSIADGLDCCPDLAGRQHDGLVVALERAGVRCHIAPAHPDLPDLTFMRDAAVMTPWGLQILNPGAAHRRQEAEHVERAAASLGVPLLGRIAGGIAEGGDICVARPGLVIIGYSGERTDKAGAKAVGALFEAHGWQVVPYCFDPHFLHLDTQLTFVGRDEAVACVEVLEDGFLDRLAGLGISLIPVSRSELRSLGSNLLALGERRIVSSLDNLRVNRLLGLRGYEVIEVEIDQFTRCGGGVHCLTLPLARGRE